jgi:arginyl-tRNA synthetase
MRERLHQQLEAVVAALLAEAGGSNHAPDFVLDVPRNEAHGDFACNAALLLARPLGQSPRAIAELIASRLLESTDWVERVEVAGPGFVNIWLAGSRWHDLLRRVLAAGPRYGRSDVGKDQRVQVEFVSANPTGPLTLGHGRNAVLGDSIARLLGALGYQVTREYYFNNAGRQMRVLGESVRARYLEQLGRAAPPSEASLADPEHAWCDEIDGLPVVFPADGYQGEYIVELARQLAAEHGEAWIDEPGDGVFREAAQARIFEEIKRTLDDMDIGFDVYSNEKDLYDEGKLDEVLADLREQDLVYERDGATWLRATACGLDRDRVLVKRTGEPTYLLPDIAYHREKFRRGFDRVIDVQGADHIEQFPFVIQAIAALGCPKDRVELVMHQFVTLTMGGEQVKQSTRRANYVTVDELLADVGVDVFRFFMVQRRAESHLDFDLDLARERDWKKNPAYYVQYAHARTYGIERKAREQGIAMPGPASVDPSSLVLAEEIEILRKISEFPALVERAGETREPHHLAYYAREVAALWNPYVQDGTRHRVLSDDAALTHARLALALGVRIVLANALALLGVGAPEQM